MTMCVYYEGVIMIKKSCFKQIHLLAVLLLLPLCLLVGCGNGGTPPAVQPEQLSGEQAVVFSGDGLAQESRMLLSEMLELPDARYEHVYSTINNWPTEKVYAARGVRMSVLLREAGLLDEAKLITVKGLNDFSWSFTREELLETPRFYYPGVVTGDAAGAEPAEPILAYQYREDSFDLNDAQDGPLCLIVPQANIREQTNIAFVKGVKEIIVSAEDPGKWPLATVFPEEGNIAPGETIKLQHQDLGKVKMYYTLDGSDPDENSALYNPSTYQPELNKPIAPEGDVVIKVLVKGFGKHDSDIAEYHFRKT